MSAATARRTSQYTLTVPGPEHADADLQSALDTLVAACPVIAQGSYLTRPALAVQAPPLLSVAYRAADDAHARAVAQDTLAAYAAAPDTEAHLHTGYGIHRRDFPVVGA